MSVITGSNGYYLRKTGARVDELLSRHFIVPTLQEAPTEDTLSWTDGNYTVLFRVGEFIRVQNNDVFTFYRLDNISEGKATWVNLTPADMKNYYTKEDIDSKEFATKEEVNNKQEILVSGQNIKTINGDSILGEGNIIIQGGTADLDDYYNKSEIDHKLSQLIVSGGGGVELTTSEEYASKVENGEIIDNILYFITVDNEPYELYIGYHLIGKKGEIENISFPYTFPIIF